MESERHLPEFFRKARFPCNANLLVQKHGYCWQCCSGTRAEPGHWEGAGGERTPAHACPAALARTPVISMLLHFLETSSVVPVVPVCGRKMRSGSSPPNHARNAGLPRGGYDSAAVRGRADTVCTLCRKGVIGANAPPPPGKGKRRVVHGPSPPQAAVRAPGTGPRRDP